MDGGGSSVEKKRGIDDTEEGRIRLRSECEGCDEDDCESGGQLLFSCEENET